MGLSGDSGPPLIRTKLQRPHLGQDLILRPHLVERLNRGMDRRLTLISAQAGAGKTTLIAQWLEQSTCPSAWLSLDTHDNDLMLFAGYFCAAVRTVYPDACGEVIALLNASQTPPARILLATFVNQLTAYFAALAPHEEDTAGRRRLLIALDDFHHITDPAIHAFVVDLIAYLPSQIHLALTTRIDPPLPLARLRARREMNELRTRDLRFNVQEAETLLERTLGRQLGRNTVDLLEEATEGWAVGLRLAGLSLRHTSDVGRYAAHFKDTSSAVIVDYLAGEVLDNQLPGVRTFLLTTSILERFDAELCAALMQGNADQPQAHEILSEVNRANLFLVPLDPAGDWFRYHHLFRDLLQAMLQRERTPAEINTLHARASRWFAQNDHIDEALSHAFAAGDMDAAVRIAADRRYALMNQAQWRRLERLLHHFSATTIAQEPRLLMLETWLLYHNGHHDRLPAALCALEERVATAKLSPTEVRHLQGEINALTGFLAIHQPDLVRAIAAAQFAIAHTPPELWIVRTLAGLVLAAARQMQGDTQSVHAFIAQGFRGDPVDSHPRRATTLMAACPLFWLAGDLEQMKQAARQCIAYCDYPATPIEGFAHYHLGRAAYYQNDLAAAEEHLGGVVRQPYLNYGEAYANAAYGLALTDLAQGRGKDADAVLADAFTFASEHGNTTLLTLLQAAQADLALRQGNTISAEQWAARFDSVPPLTVMPNFCRPLITLAKIRLAVGTPSGRHHAGTLLDQLQTYSESTRQITVLIEVLALQALRTAARCDEVQAVDLLARAVTLAQPGGFVRIFADLGAPMRALLQTLVHRKDGPVFLHRILHAFRPVTTDGRHNGADDHAANGLLRSDPLTPREMDVLALLAKRLTNGEIATELVIAPGTVKTHTLNIYAKLFVHNRREAVDRARQLGLIEADIHT